jgi:hypothetical protein
MATRAFSANYYGSMTLRQSERLQAYPDFSAVIFPEYIVQLTLNILRVVIA